jgi:hypothetical protein
MNASLAVLGVCCKCPATTIASTDVATPAVPSLRCIVAVAIAVMALAERAAKHVAAKQSGAAREVGRHASRLLSRAIHWIARVYRLGTGRVAVGCLRGHGTERDARRLHHRQIGCISAFAPGGVDAAVDAERQQDHRNDHKPEKPPPVGRTIAVMIRSPLARPREARCLWATASAAVLLAFLETCRRAKAARRSRAAEWSLSENATAEARRVLESCLA